MDICSSLADKLPCDQAAGPWAHICKASVSVSCEAVSHAVEVSRHMPEHVCAFMHTITDSDWPEHAVRSIVTLVGLALGLSLMLLGRLLYTPVLFYVPAVLVGYTLFQPLAPSLNQQFGLSDGVTYLIGAFAGLLLALLQRHVFVWLLGLLLGIMSFIGLLVGTTLLAELPYQATLAVGAVCALSGSSLVWHLERTKAWKVLACSLVGSILFTDAIGVSRISTLLQVSACTVLLVSSSWRQLRSKPKDQKAKARELAEKEAQEKALAKRRGVLGTIFWLVLGGVSQVLRFVWRLVFSGTRSKLKSE